jgi:hypothetical protein
VPTRANTFAYFQHLTAIENLDRRSAPLETFKTRGCSSSTTNRLTTDWNASAMPCTGGGSGPIA